MTHTSFATTTRGLNRDLPPMRLYEKAKKLGIWNPSDIDLSKDKLDWVKFTDEEKDLCLLLLSMFVAGEEVVTLDLLPLIQAVAQEGIDRLHGVHGLLGLRLSDRRGGTGGCSGFCRSASVAMVASLSIADWMPLWIPPKIFWMACLSVLRRRSM